MSRQHHLAQQPAGTQVFKRVFTPVIFRFKLRHDMAGHGLFFIYKYNKNMTVLSKQHTYNLKVKQQRHHCC